MKDYVKCSWCEFKGAVEMGAEKCPECKKTGYLAWGEIDKGGTPCNDKANL